MNFNPQLDRVAIMGGFQTDTLAEWIPALRDEPDPPRVFGSSNLVNLVRERLRGGRPTEVITLDDGAHERIRTWDGGLARLWVVKTGGGYFRALRGFPEEVQALREVLRRAAPRVVHANWTYEHALAALGQHRYPVVLTVHDHATHVLSREGPTYLPRYVLAHLNMRRAGVMTAPSPYVADYVRWWSGRPVYVLPNLLCTEIWQMARPADAPLNRASPTIVSAVDWCALKNTKRAIRAFERLHRSQPGAKYVLMGWGLGAGGPAEQWARAHDLAAGLTFAGKVPYEQCLEQMRQADVVFHPSLEEGFGGPVIEAMALRIPVVACCEAGGSRWLLESGACGALVPGHDVPAMAAALHATLCAPAQTASQVIRARTRAEQLSRPAGVLAGYDQVYDEVLQNMAAGPLQARSPDRAGTA